VHACSLDRLRKCKNVSHMPPNESETEVYLHGETSAKT